MNPELTTVLDLAAERRPALVNVGHGRSAHAKAAARAFAEAWAARGGLIGTVVSWPPVAASWLKPATRLVAGFPDLWVIADEPGGFRGIAGRLLATGIWEPAGTIAFAGLADPDLPALVGPEATEGLSGALRDGTPWRIDDGQRRLMPMPRLSRM